MRAPAILRDLWFRAFLRGVHYNDRYEQLDTLYRVEDPWRMDSAEEQTRFAAINAIIGREFDRPGSVLEVGSGEGHQSLWLLKACDRLHGRDISARAVERARRRCPQATFEVGDLSTPFAGEPPPFDLVVGCEVLYYIRDPQQAVDQMSRLGRACLVSYFQTQTQRIESSVVFPPQAGRETITHDGASWTAVWWKSPAP
jgi:ubiquinone/menaquinone biosynthesis C-methylase UbiE